MQLSTAPVTGKYGNTPKFKYPERTWPDQDIKKAPIWCEVGLRDGNQALENPMNVEQKLAYFQMLVDMGFKDIEVGFPSASETDFNFCRRLIEENLIPEDVRIQVLVQCRPDLMEKTYEALKGSKQAIVHFYNSTDPVQRELTFRTDKAGATKIAIEGAKMARSMAEAMVPDTEITFEYSPESFSDTEIEFALDVIHRVMDVIEPTVAHPMIVNLPQTVQRETANVFADKVEWISDHIRDRAAVVLSVHAHNDCGTGVAASEQAMLAGVDRVEGVLMGNGERCGNADMTALVGNLYSRGIDPQINISFLDEVSRTYEETTGMKVHPRQPYAGSLAFTAFSGSHQDSIKKAIDWMERRQNEPAWKVHYLHVDPTDFGREYEPVQVNSQSGKGGTAFVLKRNYDIDVPKAMQGAVHHHVQQRSENGDLLTAQEIYEIFAENFIGNERIQILNYQTRAEDGKTCLKAELSVDGELRLIEGQGTGPVNAFVEALRSAGLSNFDKLLDYEQSAQTAGSGANAISFVPLQFGEKVVWGAGLSPNTGRSAFEAILAAMARP